MKKFLIYLIIPATLFLSCNKTEYDAVDWSKIMDDSLETTYTIEQLRAEFMTDYDAYSDTTDQMGGLYTADLINSDSNVVISGRVTSTDVEGNVYKYFVIQEEGANGQAIKVSIDASGLSAIYPLGQKVWIRCNGLYIGRYGGAAQIGSRYVNKNRFKTVVSKNDSTKKDTVYRIEPGRMPMFTAQQAIYAYGLPDPKVVQPQVMTINEIFKTDTVALTNKLITIKNAYFTGYNGDNKVIKPEEMIFAPSTGGIGYPQTRMITDGTGTIAIATSEYARFANKPLPTPNYRGDITVLVGWYKNYTNSKGAWQLTLRTLGDLGAGFEGYLESVNYSKQ